MRSLNTLTFFVSGVLLISCSPKAADKEGVSEDAAGNLVVAQNDPHYGKPKQYNFASIPWGSTKLSTKNGMKKQGFSLSRSDDEGDQVYEGKLLNENATAFAQFTNQGRLVRLQIVSDPPENRFWSKYKILKESLLQKYSQPFKDEKHYDAPYKENDGFEAQAIRLGKATYNSEWYTGYNRIPNSNQVVSYAGLTLEVKDKLLMYLTYTSNDWGSEYDRRYKKGTEGL